jgi:hypothetical protein
MRGLSRALFLMLLLCCVFSLAMTERAQAYEPWGAGWWGYTGGYPFGLSNAPYRSGQVPVPPYFALHPPVYYSYPIPRTYGYSPFAYPGTMQTPEVEMAGEAALIENPHVTTPTKKDSTDDKTAVTWEVIRNPFAEANQPTHVASSEK